MQFFCTMFKAARTLYKEVTAILTFRPSVTHLDGFSAVDGDAVQVPDGGQSGVGINLRRVKDQNVSLNMSQHPAFDCCTFKGKKLYIKHSTSHGDEGKAFSGVADFGDLAEPAKLVLEDLTRAVLVDSLHEKLRTLIHGLGKTTLGKT